MTSLLNKILGWMALGVFILPSCVEEPDCSLQNDKTVDVRLTISLPKADTQNIITKANRTDYNTVNDLNVLVFNATGNLLKAVYFNSGNTGNPPEYSISPALPLNDNQLTSEITLNDLDPAYDKIFLVGNYGSQIPASVTTITQLNTLTQSAPTGIPNSAMLFAEATQTSTSGFYTYMSASLKRTLAMVTVAIDGTSLTAPSGKEIRIIPKTIKLKNVPTSGIISTNVNNISNVNTTNVAAGDQAIVTSWATLTSSNHITVGGHEETAIPLFQFENKQGNKPLDQSETLKSTSDKPYSSYLEVEAFYQYYDGSVINKSGTIIYRFCLGSDVTKNFDVVRNTHYRVTLKLSGWGGALEDGHINSGNLVIDGHADGVSWRVDLSLRDWGFLQDEYNFDAHEGYAELQLVGPSFSIERISGPTDMLKYLNPGDGWTYIGNSANANLDNNLLKIVIMPWRIAPGSDYPTSPPYRELVLRARHGSDPPQDVIFRQWAPIKLLENGDNDLYMERFEETGAYIAGDPGNSNHTWGYSGDALGGTFAGFTFAHGDAADGFNNTLYLYERDTQSTTTGVSVNSTAAQRCLRKAGYDLNRILGASGQNKTPVETNERAAWYLPSKVELERVIGYVGDLNDPYEFHDPIKTTVDYWSSSTPVGFQTQTYFWNHTIIPIVHPINPIATYTLSRNDLKQVRCVYMPSKDATIQGLPFNPKVYP